MLKTNKGTAIIIAVLTLLILSTLGASIMFSTDNSERWIRRPSLA